MGGITDSCQFFGRLKTHFLIQQIGSAGVFEIMFLCPMLITFAFFLCGVYIHHTADRIMLIDGFLHSRCGMDGFSFRSYSFCISDKDSEYSRFIKIIAQLS